MKPMTPKELKSYQKHLRVTDKDVINGEKSLRNYWGNSGFQGKIFRLVPPKQPRLCMAQMRHAELGLNIVRKLEAREAQSKTIDKSREFSWTQYCLDIGSQIDVVNRWLME